MPDPVTIGWASAAGAVVGAFIVGLARAVRGEPSDRAAIPPPALRSATIPDADLEALRGRMLAVESKASATDTRVKAIEDGAAAKTLEISRSAAAEELRVVLSRLGGGKKGKADDSGKHGDSEP